LGSTKGVEIYIDPPSPYLFRDELFNSKGNQLMGDELHSPYVFLRETFSKCGIPVHTADLLPETENGASRIYVSLGPLQGIRKVVNRKDTILSAFFPMECPIVEPSMYKALGRFYHLFKRIISWSDGPSLERFIGRSLRTEPFRRPQSFDSVHHDIWKEHHRKFLVMINANKLPRLYWQELYTERQKAVEFFSRTKDIDLYGPGWEQPSNRVGKTWVPYLIRRVHRNAIGLWQQIRPDPYLEAARRVYQGTTLSKSRTLGKYTFAICFENMKLKGYMSEKIFDCFFSGTIPIYLGAPDIDQHIPSDCFIDMRKFEGYSELRRYLKSLSQTDIVNYKECARAFLNSPQFTPFSNEALVDLFKRIVREDTGITV
jgi:hypothetical protein